MSSNPPPDLLSDLYTEEYNEVKNLGSATSTQRTLDQTDLANFWSDNIFQIFSRWLRSMATAHIDNLGDSARLFALNYFSNADAAICAWESKYYYAFWRPITAIREGDNDGNDNTIGDDSWLPFLPTPPYPEYTSGANNISGSTTRALQLFFGTNHIEFSLNSNAAPAIQKTRFYTRFSKVANEVEDVRIFQGIHFRSADTIARKQGKKVANYVFENFLQPVE